MGVRGELITDPRSGTALKSGPDLHPVRWPWGFTGRRVGSEVEVRDPDQNVVATTGGSYEVFYTEVGFGTVPNEEISACGRVDRL